MSNLFPISLSLLQKNLDPVNLDPFRSLTSTKSEIGFEGTD